MFTSGHHQRAGHLSRARGILGASLLLTALLALAWPWLSAPLMADERYMYLDVAAGADNSWSGLIERLWLETPERADTGRITPIGYLVQYVPYLLVVQFSAATGTPLLVGHVATKVVMVLLAVGALTCFLRVFQLRGSFLSRHRARQLVLLFTVALLLGGQVQVAHRSSWTAYPVLTTGAIVTAFAVPTIYLVLAERIRRSRRWLIPALGVLALLSALLTFSYELFYVSIPLALIAVAAQSPDRRRDLGTWIQRRAGFLVGLWGAGTFFVFLLWTRNTVSTLCARPGRDQECYVGTEMEVGMQTVLTAARNLVGAVPAFANGPAESERLDRAPWLGAPTDFSVTGLLIGLLAGVGLFLLLGRDPGPGTDDTRRKDRRVLWLITVFGLLIAGGSALVMALSAQAPEIVTQLGIPYRATTVTWAGLCLALVAGAMLAGLQWQPRSQLIPAGAVTVIAALIGALVWPTMMSVSQANWSHVDAAVVSKVNQQVLTPDLTAAGEADRCRLVDRIQDDLGPGYGRRLAWASDGLFHTFWGQPFCFDADPDYRGVPR